MRFFHELSMQEMFERAYAGMERQNFERSLNVSNQHSCAYRAADGKRCAVGHLIDDDDYRPGIEGYPIQDDKVLGHEAVTADLTKAEFLRDLQRAHDFATGRSGVRDRMLSVARRYALDVPNEAA